MKRISDLVKEFNELSEYDGDVYDYILDQISWRSVRLILDLYKDCREITEEALLKKSIEDLAQCNSTLYSFICDYIADHYCDESLYDIELI